MINIKTFTLLIFVLFCLSLHAETYEGTLGKNKIIFEINDNESASYIYKNYLKVISLSRNGYHFFLHGTDEKDKKELFTLRINGENLEGNWQNKTLPIHLTPMNTTISEYQGKNIKYIKISSKKFDGRTIDMLKEVHTNFAFFRLGDGFTIEQRKIFNPKLMELHESIVKDYLECDNVIVKPNISVLNTDFFSFYNEYEIECGGAHPDYGVRAFNYDLRKNIELKQISDIFPFLNYYKALKEKYAASKELQSDCEYFVSPEHWKFSEWRLVPDGVVIQPYYDYSMATCEIDFFLNNKEIKEH